MQDPRNERQEGEAADNPTRSWRSRLIWLLVLWICGVGAVGVVAIVVRLGMGLAGMRSS
ncbi:DUF2474 family protein [Cupriavidus sp. AU9028]|uniref:DUF2474 family protein n=1 Tax=Cupriavidus sp. AU9028 TaxID=2871157 RepID=UPI001C94128B|nr:DUF2474 family protein [Cupriavidus sp. AU9028]MBY4895658.1 DUF2474 family protein [Cupriavidus sp. AU9028]